MKKLYYNITIRFGEVKTPATIILNEKTDKQLGGSDEWVDAIDRKLDELFGLCYWDYRCETSKNNIEKIIIDLSGKNETFD